jgi:hypothetical protein
VDPIRTERCVPQKSSYVPGPKFTQASAASAATSSTEALPVSVRRKSRSGVRSSSPYGVCPSNPELIGGIPVSRWPARTMAGGCSGGRPSAVRR